MPNEKSIKSLISIIFIIIILVCGIIIFGVYMNEKWKSMRDVRRRGDIQTVMKAINFYLLDENGLPQNETNNEWDSSYNPDNNHQTLFKTLREGELLSYIFDPKNDLEHNYKYHRFEKGEYGCNRPFAIFQVTNFETLVYDNGEGACPERNFVLEAPNGYTIQWFE